MQVSHPAFFSGFLRENAAAFLRRSVLESQELLAFRPWLFRLVYLFNICAVAAMLLFAWSDLLLVPLPVALALPAIHTALTVWMRRRNISAAAVRDEFLAIMLLCTAWVLAYVFIVAEPLGTLVSLCNLTFIIFSMIGVAPWTGLVVYGISMAGLYSIRLFQLAIDWPAQLSGYPVNVVSAGGVGWLFLVLYVVSAFIFNLVWQQKQRNLEALAALEVANNKLRAAERARIDFLSAVTHELRTPLVAIHGYTDLLLANAVDVDTSLHTIKRSANRLHRLIEELLDVASPMNLASRMRIESIELSLILQEEISAVRAHAQACDVTIEITGSAPCYVAADQMRLGQVVANLLDNAIRHSPPGGVIRVGTAMDAETATAVLWIEDNGSGIPPESLAHIFEPFYSSPPLLTARSLGLGLSICQQIITALNGKIHVTSNLGKGSRFAIGLPLNYAMQECAQAKQNYGLRALVLDDEVDVLSLMREALAGFDFTVDTARNGTMALDLALRQEYDLILLDVNVPGLTGIEVSRRLRESNRPGKVLLFSALIRHDADQVIAEAMADGFLPKPFTFETLGQVLTRLGLLGLSTPVPL